MVQINFARKEVNCKIVYYGPGMSGKTTNLEKIFENAPDENKGDLTSIATEGDRTLFFDFLPLELGQVAGMNTKFQIYTVPGQVYYNSTRKLVLQGADGVIFVGDSQKKKLEENEESLANLAENLKEYGSAIDELPFVIQWNKQDMEDIFTLEELNAKLNPWGVPSYPAVATKGTGVFPTLKALSQLVLENLNKEYGPGSGSRTAAKPAAPKPAPKPVDAAAEAAPAAAREAAPATATRTPPQGRPAPDSGARPPARTAGTPPKPPPPRTPTPRPSPQSTPRTQPAPASAGASAARRPTPQKSGGNIGMIIILLIVLAALSVLAYAFVM